MSAYQGLARFSDWPLIGAEMTLSRGVMPSCALLRCLPHDNLQPIVDTLKFEYGPEIIQFPDAAVDATTLRISHGRDAWRWSVKVYDRRWKWRYPTVTGVYNLRLCDGSLQEAAKKNIKQLIELLLDALDESGYAINGVPEDVYPYVAWNRNLVAPQLEYLCDLVGCVVSLGTNNKVRIDPLGQRGQDLPAAPLVSPLFRSKPAVMPSKLRFVSGPTIYQDALPLEAVGLDKDGVIKPIDNLSYKPSASAGWKTEWHNAFGLVEPQYRHLAFQTVWRWYRVVNPNDYDVFDTAAESIADDTGRKRCMLPQVRGIFWPLSDHATNTRDDVRYSGPFKILRDKRIIEFEFPVIKWVNHAAYPAELKWVGAYTLVGTQDSSLKNYTKETSIGPAVESTAPRELHHPGVFVVDIKESLFGFDPSDNKSAVEAEAKAYLDAVKRTYEYDYSMDVLYEGLRNVSPDGSIAQVRWICGHKRPALTRVGWNGEFDVWTPHHQQRRAHERAVQADELRSQFPVIEMAKALKYY